ncbi:HNH endonuclease [Acinetobacter lwoffii]|uniref:HNH endonuclease n=1 Tax=Acinetobacter lwoffii TaxID=28090 RepID=UPI001FF3B1CC|nr:HNH endonuclease signature motif containing protein [Acinetobacter lwoffii]MCJ8510816.1 HNH endonuclease [Acinetobacter lwoffii]
MINLNSYNGDSISFLQEVVNSKKRGKGEQFPFYKDRITLLFPVLKSAYHVYDAAFTSNDLLYLVPLSSIDTNQKDDLLKLYKYGSKPFIKLKNAIISLPNDYELNTCQYCTINDVNTLDHIVPKESFPEFVVHPKNLIPVCSECNSYKSNKWIKDGNFEFINLYLHKLPYQQFLHVDLKYVNNTFSVKYFLKNTHNIDAILFNIIKNHYDNLKLLNRFQGKANQIISEFENTIRGSLIKLSLKDSLECAKATITYEQSRLGMNHYENVLKLTLCDSLAFMEYCRDKGYR